jgi:hypothetical protein
MVVEGLIFFGTLITPRETTILKGCDLLTHA